MIHMKNKSHIKDLRLKFCILTIFSEHHQNILCHRQFFLRCINIQVFTHFIIVSKIAVNHKHWELADQVQTLTQYIRNACIIRFVIVRIKLKNTSCNTVHHITARSLHDHVTYKIRWKHPAVSYHILKILKFLLIRKLSKKKQICNLLKSKMFRLKESAYKIFNIVTSVIKITCTRYGYTVYNLCCTHIGYICQSGKYTFTVQISKSSFYLVFGIEFFVNCIVRFTFQSKFFNLRSDVKKYAVNIFGHGLFLLLLFLLMSFYLLIILDIRP